MNRTIENAVSVRKKNWLLIGTLSVFLVTGCSTLGKYKDDVNDICYTQRQELRAAENYYATSIATRAAQGGLAGAGTGAAAGAAIAAAQGKDPLSGAIAGAITGGIIGTIAGGIGGYYEAVQKNNADAQTLAATVQNDIIKENGQIDRAAIAFSRIRDCRFSAAERIKLDYHAGRISRDEALKKLAYLKDKFNEDIAMATDLGVKMGGNMKEFQYASTQLADKIPAPKQEPVKKTIKKLKKLKPTLACGKHSKHKSGHQCGNSTTSPSVSPTPPPQTLASVAESNQNKQKDFADTINKAKAAAAVHFDLDAKVEGDAKDYLVPESLICAI